ncbi:hypothetical protein M9980_08110 [Sphingomonas donggukensis]|uniref:Uncharacterized protein n=1 Tax=Sphingomonas donggukensis TaxID=2949093 RepID=A0ABY4TQ75_9SPHN|nr:hypothetical protein [Sphingomonas donggukensis]URW74543.1 hypothetical protein M9980_08110 [Sphingomonas donggukensis]
MKKMLPAVAALSALALLAACSGSEPEAPPAADNGAEMLDVTSEAANVEEAPLAMPSPTPTPGNTADAAPPPPPEAQVQDDADATGMTARVNRDTAAEEETQPADTTVSEEKR